jgi:hypothetical protein
MIVTYLRSSSFNSHELCEQQFFLSYVLGIQSPTGIKADKGSVVHAVLECLARFKKCKQESLSSWVDERIGHVKLEDCDPDILIKRVFDYYVANTTHDWKNRDFKDCEAWVYNVLNFDEGRYDPRNRKIIAPEQPFDFEINQPWAKFHYKLPEGKELSGFLSIKGTMDLITERRPGIIEIIDWKTGERMDWGTGKEKTYEKLCNDPQLRLYHYAAHRIFPEYKDIIITIFFARDGKYKGGPFTVMLAQEDLPETERIIKDKFEEIRLCQKPYLKPHPSWSGLPKKPAIIHPCTTFCYFGKNLKDGTNKNLCEFYKMEVDRIGMDKVVEKYANLDIISEYGDAAGKKKEDRK